MKMQWKTKCFNIGRGDCCTIPSGACAMWYLVLALAGLAVCRGVIPDVPAVVQGLRMGPDTGYPELVPIGLRIRNWALLCVLTDVSISDIRTRIIPNRSIIAGILLWGMGIVRIGKMQVVWFPWKEAVSDIAAASSIGILCFFLALLFTRIRKSTALGGGDIKLLFLGGLLLGPADSLYMILIAGILGLLTAAVMHAFSGRKPIPFGPAVACAIAALLFSP